MLYLFYSSHDIGLVKATCSNVMRMQQITQRFTDLKKKKKTHYYHLSKRDKNTNHAVRNIFFPFILPTGL